MNSAVSIACRIFTGFLSTLLEEDPFAHTAPYIEHVEVQLQGGAILAYEIHSDGIQYLEQSTARMVARAGPARYQEQARRLSAVS